MTFREKFKSACLTRFKALGRRLTAEEVYDEAAAIHEFEVLEWEKAKKERKKSGIDERAANVLNVYPRREGGEAALLSISKAITKDGFDCVLERTAEYGQAVARWAPNRRKAQSGASLIPLPTTFFNQRRYMDDAAVWWEGTGGKQKLAPIESIAPPEGWLPWLTTELSLLSEDHPAHSQLLFALNSRQFSGLPDSWKVRCNQQLKHA